MATDNRRRRIPYVDPTGDEAAANVDRARTLADGVDPDLAWQLTEALLPPAEEPYLHTAGGRESDGSRTVVPPFREIGPYGVVPHRPLTNEQVLMTLIQLSPLLTRSVL